jgi:hypothetical protein
MDDQRQRARVVDRPTAGQSTDIWDVAPPIMNDLSKRLQESCFAAVLDQDSVIYVARATSNQRVSVGISISSRVPAHCVSTGRVLLAALPQDLLHKYLEAMTLTKFTPNTLTSKGPIARRLRRGALARLVDRGSGVGSPGFARFRRRSGAARARSSLLIETLTHSSLRFAVSLPGCPLASRDRRPPPSADSGDTRAGRLSPVRQRRSADRPRIGTTCLGRDQRPRPREPLRRPFVVSHGWIPTFRGDDTSGLVSRCRGSR